MQQYNCITFEGTREQIRAFKAKAYGGQKKEIVNNLFPMPEVLTKEYPYAKRKRVEEYQVSWKVKHWGTSFFDVRNMYLDEHEEDLRNAAVFLGIKTEGEFDKWVEYVSQQWPQLKITYEVEYGDKLYITKGVYNEGDRQKVQTSFNFE